MRRVYKNVCPATISASIMAANMWKNSLKKVESDNNNILYETLFDFLNSETALTFWISLVIYSVQSHLLLNLCFPIMKFGVRGAAVRWGTMLQTGRSRVRFPMNGIFHWHKPSGHTMALGLTQPLTEMSTRNISWRVKAAGAWGWKPYHLHMPIVLKSGRDNLLENSSSVQACNGLLLWNLKQISLNISSIVTL